MSAVFAPPTLPLFPLNTVVFPGGRLPLRIFEQRYLDMVKQAIADNTPFGICAIREGTETGTPAVPHAVGTRVIVTDSGMGIRSDFLPFVFEKFARGTPDDGGREGRGLGLHVVKTLVEAHGGTIAVESKGPGRGSRFIITLPARLAAAV